MVKSRRKPRPKRKKKKSQPIPGDVKKGDPVLYMLQRLGDDSIQLVDYMVTRNNRNKEQYLLDLFKDKAFRMSRKISPPSWYSSHQVKFGITNNLQARLDSICDDPFESGVTEWRKLSNGEMAIAHNKFWWWRNRGKVYKWAFLLLSIAALILYLFNQFLR
ncbi:MAG: hypothetical protein ACWA44_02550 [Thiotrichales bacterium]